MLSKILTTISIFSLTTFSFSAVFATTSPSKSSIENPIPTTLEAIDKEIQQLEEELQRYRSEAFKEEMQAQPYMLDNWHRFAHEIEQHEDKEKKILSIQERLKKLHEQKRAVTNGSSSSP